MHPPEADEAIPPDWFASAFDALYPVVYAHRSLAAAEPEARFAIEELRLSKEARVLDLCCGNGRHLVHMARHTPHIVGLDYSLPLLRLARQQLGGRGGLVRADMRAIPFIEAFDAVVNFFTSFGYFHSHAENLSVLRGMSAALKPGAGFFMDYLNPPQVRSSIVPESCREQDGYRIQERRWIDEETRRVNKRTEIYRGNELVSRAAESVRLYEVDELRAASTAAGLEIERLYGDYLGSPFSTAARRMIVIGRKRGSHG